MISPFSDAKYQQYPYNKRSIETDDQVLLIRSGRGKIQMFLFNSVILSIHLSFVRTMVGYSFSHLHLDFFYCFYTVLFWLPWTKILPEEPLKYSQGHRPSTVPTVVLDSHGKAPSIPWPDPSFFLASLHITIMAIWYGLSHCILILLSRIS